MLVSQNLFNQSPDRAYQLLRTASLDLDTRHLQQHQDVAGIATPEQWSAKCMLAVVSITMHLYAPVIPVYTLQWYAFLDRICHGPEAGLQQDVAAQTDD